MGLFFAFFDYLSVTQ